MKAFQPREKLLNLSTMYATIPLAFPRILGMLEILGAIGIIVPALINIYPALTGVAAVCMGLVLVGAVIIHVKQKEYKILPVIILLLILAATVAYVRLKGV